jgi:hypothetical protein
MDMDNISDVSEAHVASMLRVKLWKTGEVLCKDPVSRNGEVRIERECWCLIWSNRESGREKAVQTAILRGPKCNRKILQASDVLKQSLIP